MSGGAATRQLGHGQVALHREGDGACALLENKLHIQDVLRGKNILQHMSKLCRVGYRDAYYFWEGTQDPGGSDCLSSRG